MVYHPRLALPKQAGKLGRQRQLRTTQDNIQTTNGGRRTKPSTEATLLWNPRLDAS